MKSKLKLTNKSIFLFVLFFLFSTSYTKGQSGQYKENTEVGSFGGVSYYLGDLNNSHFNNSIPNFGLIVRKNIDRRISYKGSFMLVNIAADDRNSSDEFASQRGLHFSNNMFEENGSSIYELSGQFEFNFLPYELGNPLYKWTPFLYSGLSLFNFNPKAENKNGEWISLQPLGTEGQGTTQFPDRKKYSLIQFAIPIGGGVKFAVSEHFNIILEYGIRKTFTDYLDDVSTTYAGENPNSTNPYPIGMSLEAQEMSDPVPTSEKHTLGEERGDPNKNDWYSFAGITLSFKIPQTTIGCDY